MGEVGRRWGRDRASGGARSELGRSSDGDGPGGRVGALARRARSPPQAWRPPARARRGRGSGAAHAGRGRARRPRCRGAPAMEGHGSSVAVQWKLSGRPWKLSGRPWKLSGRWFEHEARLHHAPRLPRVRMARVGLHSAQKVLPAVLEVAHLPVDDGRAEQQLRRARPARESLLKGAERLAELPLLQQHRAERVPEVPAVEGHGRFVDGRREVRGRPWKVRAVGRGVGRPRKVRAEGRNVARPWKVRAEGRGVGRPWKVRAEGRGVGRPWKVRAGASGTRGRRRRGRCARPGRKAPRP